MEWYANDTAYRLDFHIKLSDESRALTEIGFAYLVEMKFDAEKASMRRFWAGRDLCGGVELQFDSYKSYSDAKLHCQDKITQHGDVASNYVGAMNYADRGGRVSRAMLVEIKASKSTNSEPEDRA